MHSTRLPAALLTAAFVLGTSSMNAVLAAPLPSDNPFARASTLPFQAPPLDRIRNEHFAPALEAGMAEQRREIEAIANSSEAPTFENTIVAMERSGELLTRVNAVFFNLSSSNTNDTLERVQTEDRPEVERLMGNVRTALTDRKWADLTQASNALADILFYLEDA